MIFASVPELDARFGHGCSARWPSPPATVFALEYLARLWTVAGHTQRRRLPATSGGRGAYAFSALGIVDLWPSCRPRSCWPAAGTRRWLRLGVLPFFKLIRYSPACSLLAALHAERTCR